MSPAHRSPPAFACTPAAKVSQVARRTCRATVHWLMREMGANTDSADAEKVLMPKKVNKSARAALRRPQSCTPRMFGRDKLRNVLRHRARQVKSHFDDISITAQVIDGAERMVVRSCSHKSRLGMRADFETSQEQRRPAEGGPFGARCTIGSRVRLDVVNATTADSWRVSRFPSD
jgi:hypothetical protein